MYLDVVTIRSAPLDEKLRHASAAGFAGVELWAEDLDDAAVDPGRVRATAAAAGLEILGVCPQADLYRWHHAWDIHLERTLHRRLARYRAIGARYVVLPVMDEAGDLEQTAANLRRAAEIAGETGIAVGLEPIGHIRKLASVRVATELVAEVGRDGPVGLVLDSFHFFRGGNTFADLAAVPGERILAVQLADAMPLPLAELRGARHRLYPGEGIFDVVGLCRRLDERGYAGPFVVELLNEAYWAADPATVAGRARASAMDVLARAGLAMAPERST